MTASSRAMEFQHLGTLESKMNIGQSLVGFGGPGIRKRSFEHSDYIPRDDRCTMAMPDRNGALACQPIIEETQSEVF
jgi:hypothetical protein